MADTYTIQFRRGMYADFDTSKIRPGEPVAILGNDPSVPSGKALYIAFAANDVRRLCSIEDITEMANAGEFVGPQGPQIEQNKKDINSLKENLKNTIDPTLTVSGKAADAAKVREAVNAEAERAKEVENQLKEGLNSFATLGLYVDGDGYICQKKD
jgi:hypothetical protein